MPTPEEMAPGQEPATPGLREQVAMTAPEALQRQAPRSAATHSAAAADDARAALRNSLQDVLERFRQRT